MYQMSNLSQETSQSHPKTVGVTLQKHTAFKKGEVMMGELQAKHYAVHSSRADADTKNK